MRIPLNMQSAFPVFQYFGWVKVIMFIRQPHLPEVNIHLGVGPVKKRTYLEDPIIAETEYIQGIPVGRLAFSKVGKPNIRFKFGHSPFEGFQLHLHGKFCMAGIIYLWYSH